MSILIFPICKVHEFHIIQIYYKNSMSWCKFRFTSVLWLKFFFLIMVLKYFYVYDPFSQPCTLKYSKKSTWNWSLFRTSVSLLWSGSMHKNNSLKEFSLIYHKELFNLIFSIESQFHNCTSATLPRSWNRQRHKEVYRLSSRWACIDCIQ